MRTLLTLSVLSGFLVGGCATSGPQSMPASAPDAGDAGVAGVAPAQVDATQQGGALASDRASAGASASAPSALHNVHPATSKLTSGAVPEGDAAFAELAARGFRTIISVDGASPDVARAERFGLRYVHIPITYAEVTHAQQREIARAVRDLPGPIYIHCHHGKHRSPAAAAAVAVLLGEMTPDEGVAFMKRAGTAAGYTGLYACVREAQKVSGAEIDAAPGVFASVRRPEGMTAAMVEIDVAYEHLQEVREAGWKTPADHPDLVPAAEAGRLADHLRTSGEDPRAQALGADFMDRMRRAVEAATALETALATQPVDAARAAAAWQPVADSCTSCHVKYRNVPGR